MFLLVLKEDDINLDELKVTEVIKNSYLSLSNFSINGIILFTSPMLAAPQSLAVAPRVRTQGERPVPLGAGKRPADSESRRLIRPNAG